MNRFDKPFRTMPLYDTKKGMELFNLASKLDTHELLQYSLINQIPLDFADDNGNNLIHEVINIDYRSTSPHAKLNVIKFLVQHGVNPDKPNKYNQTPLHLACNLQLDIIVDYLLSHGANPNYQDNMGLSSFHYLLTGDIKLLNDLSDHTVDFIPPPTNKDVKKNTTILEIKKLLWDLINDTTNEELPLLQTIKNTINNIMDEDTDIIARLIDFQNNIIPLIQSSDSASQNPRIKQQIELTKKTISDKIIRLFNPSGTKELPKITNLKIHTPNELSWSPLADTNTTNALIQNGNIKKRIKQNLQAEYLKIKTLNDAFSSLNYNEILPNINENFNALFINKILPNINPVWTRPPRASPNDNWYDTTSGDYTEFEQINDNIRHPLALDNASSIIDFKNLKYAGGPRKIQIIPASHNINNDLLYLFYNKSYNHQILYLLLYENDENARTIVDLIIIDDFDTTIQNILNNPIIETFIDNYLQNRLSFALPVSQFLCSFYRIFLVLSYIAICFPLKFNDTIETLRRIIINNIPYFNKWSDLYINKDPETFNIGTWIFGMWTDLTCKFNNSNLDGLINFKLLMLIGGIGHNNNNYASLQSIINCYKPQLVSTIFTVGTSDANKITKWILLLVNDNVNMEFYQFITTNNIENIENIDLIPNINQDLKELSKEVFRTINEKTDPTTICKKIILYCQNCNPKPLTQTLLDTIYLIKTYRNMTRPIDNAFLNMNILNYNNNIPNIVLPPIIPSNISILNYNIDIINYNGYDGFIKTHLIIAHLLGLSYEGIIFPLLDSTNDTNYLVIPDGAGNYIHLYLVGQTTHAINIGDQLQNQIPLPLNFLILNTPLDNNDLINKDRYYNIRDRLSSIPLTDSYHRMIIYKIIYYNNKITELKNQITPIIFDLMNGKTRELSKLYTNIYYNILFYSKLIETIYLDIKDELESNPIFDTYKEEIKYNVLNLARALNKINSNYYIYYYLFTPSKLIKLNKLNYFKIPTDRTSDKYLYYNYPNSELINITDDNEVIRKPIMNDTISAYRINAQSEIIKDLSKGLVNDFHYGNFKSYLSDYENGIFNTNLYDYNREFITKKESTLPPALRDSLNEFYEYSLIEIIKKIIKNINDTARPMLNTNINQILSKIDNLFKNTKMDIKDDKLSQYLLIANLIEELIKDQYNVYIDEAIIKYYNTFLMLSDPTNPTKIQYIQMLLSSVSKAPVNLSTTNINLEKVTDKTQMINLFSLVDLNKSPQQDYILYPNDLTNTSTLKSTTGVYINQQIIKSLLKGGASPYLINLEGLTSIHPIIKNYNYKIINQLKNLDVSFRDFFKVSPSVYVSNDIQNNLDKVLIDSSKPLKDLLSNIDGYLYNEIKRLILANENFGKNILINLENAFHLSTYLTLQYLSESLLDTNLDYTIYKALNILKLVGFDNKIIYKNYLFDIAQSFNIPNNVDILIINDILKTCNDKLIEKNKENAKLKQVIKKLKAHNPSDLSINQIKTSTKYTTLQTDIKTLTLQISQLDSILTSVSALILDISSYQTQTIYKLVPRYDIDVNRLIIMKAWDRLFAKEYDNSNYNLSIIYLLEKQKELVSKITPNNISTLRDITEAMENINNITELYFKTNKYTNENKALRFINDALLYITKMVIGNGIELMMRKILFTYFSSTLIEDDIEKITEHIDFILTSNLLQKSESIVDNLYNEVCPLLVKNSANIFEDKIDKMGHTTQPVREILLNFFNLLDISVFNLNEDIKNIFKTEVTAYFDTIIGRTILLLHVNIENIFKYFINNYRALKTLTELES